MAKKKASLLWFIRRKQGAFVRYWVSYAPGLWTWHPSRKLAMGYTNQEAAEEEARASGCTNFIVVQEEK